MTSMSANQMIPNESPNKIMLCSTFEKKNLLLTYTYLEQNIHQEASSW